MTMNSQLIALYKKYSGSLFDLDGYVSQEMHGPFLISASTKYEYSNLKVAFIGQETNGWTCHKSIESQMTTYARFDYGKHYYASPFWNVIRKVEKALKIEPYSSMWLNLNRYDENNKRPSRERLMQLQLLDEILYKELVILNPNIIIFFTGHRYDKRIMKLLDATNESIVGFKHKQLSKIISTKLPSQIYRTYHPNYLRRSGLEKQFISLMQNLYGNK